MSKDPSATGLPRPRKHPIQSRAVFTVQAIYDGFVRIWRRDGPAAATTRAIALETGYAVGTIYDYFPNRTALLAGYYQHCIDTLCERLIADNAANAASAWPDRLAALVRRTYGHVVDGPYFDREMLLLEPQIADPNRQRRVFAQCRHTWQACIANWPDRPGDVPVETVDTLLQTIWGSMRYGFVLEREASRDQRHSEHLVIMAIALLKETSVPFE